jgi:uncharacterized protein (DUF58 family)
VSSPPRRSRRRHPRAVAAAIAGAVGLVAAGGFGTPSLRPLGIGLLALGVGSIALVEIVARGIRVVRVVSRDTISQGDRAVVTVRLQGWPVRNRVLALLDWEIRPGLPDAARPEERRPAWVGSEIRQDVGFTGLPRGEHRFGPPSVALADPFGLARVRRAARSESTLLVLPRTVPIVVPFWESGSARRSGQHTGLLRGRAELGGVRDYEPGDPFSLIHWGQTARRGRLQTKELHGESGRGASLLAILDAKDSPGNGAPPDGPFELAVAAAASLVAGCAARGDAVGLEHTAARPVILPLGTPPLAMERELALVQADGQQSPALALRSAVGRHETPRTVVVVTAGGDRALASAVTQARGAGVAVAAVLVGPARVFAQDLRRAGAWVAEVTGPEDLAVSLDRSGVARARSV